MFPHPTRAIDRMVYDLYGLTGEEIKIVEESVGECFQPERLR